MPAQEPAHSFVYLLAGLISLALFTVLLTSCNGDGGALVCNPLNFGATGDGTTDDTTSIQNAIDSCAAQGGGDVELSPAGKGSYLTGPLTLKSHVHLIIDRGVTLQATSDHSRYVAAWVNWVYRPHEALISAKGATDVAILGDGIIDGAGDQPDPKDGGRTWHDLGATENAMIISTRPWMVEFYQCEHVRISGVTLQHQPYWVQALRFSKDIIESGVTIYGFGRNSDGVDLVGVTNAVVSDMDINDSDDNIAVKSGLAIHATDPYYSREIGLPQIPSTHVLIKNITARFGQGLSIGSDAVNGVSDVTIENVNFTNILFGFHIKSGRDRGGDVHDIHIHHFRMTGGNWPIAIDPYYSTIGPDPKGGPAQPVTSTTPHIHDIFIDDLVATDVGGQSYIHGLPESCVHNLTLQDVSIQTRALGLELLHMTGTFDNVTSTPVPPNPPFQVDENVTVATAGTTPAIAATPPAAGQIACNSQ